MSKADDLYRQARDAEERKRAEWLAGEPARQEAARLQAEEAARLAEERRLAYLAVEKQQHEQAEKDALEFIEKSCRPMMAEAVRDGRYRIVVHTEAFNRYLKKGLYSEAVCHHLRADGFIVHFQEREYHDSGGTYGTVHIIEPYFSISWEREERKQTSATSTAYKQGCMLWICAPAIAVLGLFVIQYFGGSV